MIVLVQTCVVVETIIDYHQLSCPFERALRPSVHTNPKKLSTEIGAFRKRSWKRCFAFKCGRKTKIELFENDYVTIITWFVCLSLPQTQIQNGGWNSDWHVDFVTWVQLNLTMRMLTGALKRFCRLWLFRFQISPALCERRTFYLFSTVDEKHLMRF